MHARVLRDVRTSFANPIGFAAGDIVQLGARDDEWPAFAWVTTRDGHAGWAPVERLQPRSDGNAVALRDYTARELDADAGDVVTRLSELGGWWWARRVDGAQGWLPARDLEPIESELNETCE